MKFLPTSYRLRRRRSLFIALAALLVLTAVALFGNTPAEAEARMITVAADGYQRTIQTKVASVSEALEKAGVSVGEHDLVEPSLDTAIIDPIFNINVYRARPVTIVDGVTTRQIMTPYSSERLIAADAGIVVYPEDRFTLERVDNILEAGFIGQRLTIHRAIPVTIEFYGNSIIHRTHAATVGEVLAERGIELKENDRVEPAADSPLAAARTLRIIHTGTLTTTEEVAIIYPTEFIYDSNRIAGSREVVTPGSDGVRLVTFEIILENSDEVGRIELQSIVKTEPVTEVVIIGTQAADPSSNVALGQSMAAARGWIDGEWQCLYNLWTRESKWNHLAENPYSGAYGIPQALPGSKMASHGDDWMTNPATQIAWGLDYIASRYGTPCGAWNFFSVNNWY